jgi:hypothetical protein
MGTDENSDVNLEMSFTDPPHCCRGKLYLRVFFILYSMLQNLQADFATSTGPSGFDQRPMGRKWAFCLSVCRRSSTVALTISIQLVSTSLTAQPHAGTRAVAGAINRPIAIAISRLLALSAKRVIL